MKIESTPGEGAVFTVDVPMVTVGHPERSEGSPPAVFPRDSSLAAQNDSIIKWNILVIDDEETIRLAWKIKKTPLGIKELKMFPSMEACSTAEVNFHSIDVAYVDKNIPGTTWTLEQTITFLKNKGVKKVIIATGEVTADLTNDPACTLADGVAKEKIPAAIV